MSGEASRPSVCAVLSSVAALTLALFWTSCSTVSSIAPVGDSPVELDPEDWDGYWMMELGDDGTDQLDIYRVTVADAESGKLRINRYHANPKFAGQPVEAYIRTFRNWMFFSVGDADNEERPRLYSFGRAYRVDETLFVWWADDDPFHELMEAGELPLIQQELPDDGRRLVLGELREEHLLRITKSPWRGGFSRRGGLFYGQANRFHRVPEGHVP